MPTEKVIAYIILAFWMFHYNAYFGNNWSPQSDAEVICDGIFIVCTIMIIVGFK